MNRFDQYGTEDDMEREQIGAARGVVASLTWGLALAIILGLAFVALARPSWAQAGGEGNNTGCQGAGNPNSPCAPGGAGGEGGGPGGSSASSLARARAAASASARQRQTQSATLDANQQQTVNVTGVGTAGGTYREQRQVPSAFVGSPIPPVCGAGFSGGAANQNGTGILGLSWETESCRKDRLAARLAALGRPDAGLALLCSMTEVREALAATGRPCVEDQAQRQDAAGPVQALIVPPPASPSTPPDWCLTASRSERRRHPECTP